MIKRHTVEIIEELDKDGKVVSRTTITTDETDDNHYGKLLSADYAEPVLRGNAGGLKVRRMIPKFPNPKNPRDPDYVPRLSAAVKTAAMSYLRIGSSGKIKTATCFAAKNVPSRIMASAKSTTCFKKESDENGRNVKDRDGNHRRLQPAGRHSTCVHL